MSDLKAKMHQNRFPLALRPWPAGGYSAPPDSLAEFKGPTSTRRRRDRKERGGKGKGEALALRWYVARIINPALSASLIFIFNNSDLPATYKALAFHAPVDSISVAGLSFLFRSNPDLSADIAHLYFRTNSEPARISCWVLCVNRLFLCKPCVDTHPTNLF